VADIDQRIARLEEFEIWGTPSRVNFEALVGAGLWAAHWRNHEGILELMREAEKVADAIRRRIAESQSVAEPPVPTSTDTAAAPLH
jgi:hypothetical protein